MFFSARAFHIVGGELTFETIRPGLYRIILIQYYDEAQTINNTYDALARVHIFSNKDNLRKAVIDLPRRRITNVPYTNIKCVIDELKTSRVEYSQEFALEPSDFADPEGYYISWERCCRNLGIDNVVNPSGAGMNYVAEIPPLFKDGAPFVNSTPVSFRPLRDYACIDKFYYVNFTGTDPDGDSLSYKMATPLNSSAIFPAAPTPQPKPHIPVRFVSGFSKDVSIKGSPPLNISKNGLLTVVPEETGLFVFSVLVEEWRDGEKLGSVQRDFQMLVVDGCAPPDPPVVGVRIPGQPDFDPETDILNYSAEDDKCFEFFVTNIEDGEEISFRAEIPDTFTEIENVFEISSTFVDDGEDTLYVQVCAPDCPPVRDGPFILDLIAGDDECPLPQLDTARLTFNIEPPPNEFPLISPGDNSFFVNESDLFSLDITGIDADGDTMDMFLVVDGIEDPEAAGFSLTVNSSVSGQIEGTLNWDTDCLLYDFSQTQQFNVRVFVDDRDTCMVMNPDHLFLSMNLVLPPNTKPEVTTTTTDFQVNSKELLIFQVDVTDPDGDSVFLRMFTPDFDAEALGISFNEASGVGQVSGEFSWEIDCSSALETGMESFDIHFLGEDSDRCKINNEDTLKVTVQVDFVENEPPEFAFYDSYAVKIDETFTLDISATDGNAKDTLTLRFLDQDPISGSAGFSFPQVKGQGLVTSTLIWTPGCDQLDPGTINTSRDLLFEVADNGCPESSRDTLVLQVELYDDQVSFAEFSPPNVFSPNGDGYNDQFSLTNLEDPSMNLPGDNCLNTFEYVSILDRNGKSIFRTSDREFIWSGDNVPPGVYFYVVKYTRREYKGHLKLLR